MLSTNDINSLEKHLQRAKRLTEQSGGGILVISEGVFGMRGDQGKLREIVALKEKYDRLFVDAHGFGMLGKTGAGTGEEQNVQMPSTSIFRRLPNRWPASELFCRHTPTSLNT
ncbi:MAG: hypothetical protein R2806_23735 [Saprospiraceae bacterium]